MLEAEDVCKAAALPARRSILRSDPVRVGSGGSGDVDEIASEIEDVDLTAVVPGNDKEEVKGAVEHDDLAVAFPLVDLLPGNQVPQPDGAVAGGGAGPVRAHRHPPYVAGVAGEHV